VTNLKKRDVERMHVAYERNPEAALTSALRLVLDRPDLDFTALVKLAGFTCDRRIRLQAKDQRALDELFTELNELRGLSPRT
jgi:hypothetical protein